MRACVLGLGSMGQRRIRCLKALGMKVIAGFDLREDRRQNALKAHEIAVFDDARALFEQFRPDFCIISAPPDAHHRCMLLSLEYKTPFFVEAGILDTNYDEIIRLSEENRILAAPSITQIFHPAKITISQVVSSGVLGKLSNVFFHVGQWLADWHSYEAVSDFYVSKKATGGAREMVPFELTWMTKLFGMPTHVLGQVRKTVDIQGAPDIDDTYNCLLETPLCLINLSIDVVSRYGTRRLLVNGDKGQLRWDWDDDHVRLYQSQKKAWEKVPYSRGNAAPGYNPNISEETYINEIKAFISAVKREKAFPNTMRNDWNILKILYALEESDRTGVRQELFKTTALR